MVQSFHTINFFPFVGWPGLSLRNLELKRLDIGSGQPKALTKHEIEGVHMRLPCNRSPITSNYCMWQAAFLYDRSSRISLTASIEGKWNQTLLISCLWTYNLSNLLRGQVGGGWALEIEAFLVRLKCQASVIWGPKKVRAFQGPTPFHLPK